MNHPDPDPAWLAADAAFDEDVFDEPGGGDELARALVAAAPHHRVAELDERIAELRRELSLLPGWRNTGRREGIEIALRLLAERKAQITPRHEEIP